MSWPDFFFQVLAKCDCIEWKPIIAWDFFKWLRVLWATHMGNWFGIFVRQSCVVTEMEQVGLSFPWRAASTIYFSLNVVQHICQCVFSDSSPSHITHLHNMSKSLTIRQITMHILVQYIKNNQVKIYMNDFLI